MSLETNRKILYATISKYLNEKDFLAKTTPEHIIILSLLVEALEYAYQQYNAGNMKYREKIKQLQRAIQKFKYGCEKICNIKDTFKVIPTNNPPIIEHKDLYVLIKPTFEVFNYVNFVGEVTDPEGDEIEKIWVVAFDETVMDFKINNGAIAENQTINDRDLFSVRLKGTTAYRYLVLNTIVDHACVATLLKVNAVIYNSYTDANNYIVTSISKSDIKLEKRENGVIDHASIPYENVGQYVNANVYFRAKQMPNPKMKDRYSDLGTTTVHFYKECDITPDCTGGINTITITGNTAVHIDERNFVPPGNITIGSIKIIEATDDERGYFTYQGNRIEAPLTIDRRSFSGLRFIPTPPQNPTTGQHIAGKLKYVLANRDSINYCDTPNEVHMVYSTTPVWETLETACSKNSITYEPLTD